MVPAALKKRNRKWNSSEFLDMSPTKGQPAALDTSICSHLTALTVYALQENNIIICQLS